MVRDDNGSGSNDFAAGRFIGVNRGDLATRFVRDALPYLDPMYRAARRYTHHHVDAEDLV